MYRDWEFYGEDFDNANPIKLLRHLANAFDAAVYGDGEKLEHQLERTERRLGSEKEQAEYERIKERLLDLYEFQTENYSQQQQKR